MKYRALTLLAVLFSLCLISAACAENSPPDTTSLTEAKDIAVTDAHGREVRIGAPAERIVVLAPGDCEILYALGAGDKIIAAGSRCDFPEPVRSLPTVASDSETNIEQLLSLNPDLVVIYETSRADETAQTLSTSGIPAVITRAENIASTYDTIRILGRLTGKSPEAETLISSMQGTFDLISKLAGNTGKTVYFEISPLSDGLMAAGKNTFMDDIAVICGLKNIFSDVNGIAAISQEQVIERNPDIIITIPYSDNGPSLSEEISHRPGWDRITAVKQGRIECAVSGEIARPGPRLRNAAIRLFQLSNPDAARSLNAPDISDNADISQTAMNDRG